MFIAKFNQVSSDKFTANRHGQMPYIGTVLAGISLASIVDATIFENAHNIPGVLYLCENGVRTFEGKDFPTVEIVSPVTALEYVTLRKELGAGKLQRAAAVVDPIEPPVETAEEIAAKAKLALA